MNTTLLIAVFVGTLGISLWASWRVRSVYEKFNRQPARAGMTGAEVAARMLLSHGIRNVEILSQRGHLTDHYDPINRRLVLSEANYHGRSISAISVAAHEAGHAVQHAADYAPLHWRMAAVGITSFASSLVTWLPLIGMVTGLFATTTGFLLMAIGWGVITVFNLITLPVEFDASRRAALALSGSGYVTPDETRGVKSVLNAAALTYVGALITSLAWMFYHILPLLAGQEE